MGEEKVDQIPEYESGTSSKLKLLQNFLKNLSKQTLILTVVGLILIFSILVVLLSSNTNRTDVTQITTQSEYNQAFAEYWQDYSDANILMSAIIHVDPSQTTYETWQGWINQNKQQWDLIEQKALVIINYIDSDTVGLSFFPAVYAQAEEVEQTLTDPNSGYVQTIKSAYGDAPRGEKLKAVMQLTGIESPREARDFMAKIDNWDSSEYLDDARFYDHLYHAASYTKKASFAIVCVGSVVITAGIVAAPIATYGVAAKTVALATTSIAGADMVLEIGGNVAYVLDNRQAQSVLVQAKENLQPITDVAAIVGVATGGANDDPVGTVVTIYSYGERMYDWYTANDEREDVVYELNLSPVEPIESQTDEELYQDVVESDDPIGDAIMLNFPKDAGFIVEGVRYSTKDNDSYSSGDFARDLIESRKTDSVPGDSAVDSSSSDELVYRSPLNFNGYSGQAEVIASKSSDGIFIEIEIDLSGVDYDCLGTSEECDVDIALSSSGWVDGQMYTTQGLFSPLVSGLGEDEPLVDITISGGFQDITGLCPSWSPDCIMPTVSGDIIYDDLDNQYAEYAPTFFSAELVEY